MDVQNGKALVTLTSTVPENTANTKHTLVGFRALGLGFKAHTTHCRHKTDTANLDPKTLKHRCSRFFRFGFGFQGLGLRVQFSGFRFFVWGVARTYPHCCLGYSSFVGLFGEGRLGIPALRVSALVLDWVPDGYV